MYLHKNEIDEHFKQSQVVVHITVSIIRFGVQYVHLFATTQAPCWSHHSLCTVLV